MTRGRILPWPYPPVAGFFVVGHFSVKEKMLVKLGWVQLGFFSDGELSHGEKSQSCILQHARHVQAIVYDASYVIHTYYLLWQILHYSGQATKRLKKIELPLFCYNILYNILAILDRVSFNLLCQKNNNILTHKNTQTSLYNKYFWLKLSSIHCASE